MIVERHWGPRKGDEELIRRHLDRQAGIEPSLVRLDTGALVPVGRDAAGEGEGGDEDECQ